MTRNGEALKRTVFPTGSVPFPKMSSATLFPRKTTRRCSFTSSGLRNRPPGTGIRFRISPNSGVTPETSTGKVFRL